LSVDPGEKADLKARHADIFAQIKERHSVWSAGMLPRPQA